MSPMLVSLVLAQKRRYPQSGNRAADPTIVETHNLEQSSSSATFNQTLYTSSSSFIRQRRLIEQDMNLVRTARDAKDRLDKKLRARRKSDVKRTSNKDIESLGCVEGGSMLVRDMQMQMKVYGSKKRSILSRLCHKESKRKECSICLERYKVGETLLHLPCSHRFHLECLNPWLENNAHCPYCRMSINCFVQANR